MLSSDVASLYQGHFLLQAVFLGLLAYACSNSLVGDGVRRLFLLLTSDLNAAGGVRAAGVWVGGICGLLCLAELVYRIVPFREENAYGYTQLPLLYYSFACIVTAVLLSALRGHALQLPQEPYSDKLTDVTVDQSWWYAVPAETALFLEERASGSGSLSYRCFIGPDAVARVNVGSTAWAVKVQDEPVNDLKPSDCGVYRIRDVGDWVVFLENSSEFKSATELLPANDDLARLARGAETIRQSTIVRLAAREDKQGTYFLLKTPNNDLRFQKWTPVDRDVLALGVDAQGCFSIPGSDHVILEEIVDPGGPVDIKKATSWRLVKPAPSRYIKSKGYAAYITIPTQAPAFVDTGGQQQPSYYRLSNHSVFRVMGKDRVLSLEPSEDLLVQPYERYFIIQNDHPVPLADSLRVGSSGGDRAPGGDASEHSTSAPPLSGGIPELALSFALECRMGVTRVEGRTGQALSDLDASVLLCWKQGEVESIVQLPANICRALETHVGDVCREEMIRSNEPWKDQVRIVFRDLEPGVNAQEAAALKESCKTAIESVSQTVAKSVPARVSLHDVMDSRETSIFYFTCTAPSTGCRVGALENRLEYLDGEEERREKYAEILINKPTPGGVTREGVQQVIHGSKSDSQNALEGASVRAAVPAATDAANSFLAAHFDRFRACHFIESGRRLDGDSLLKNIDAYLQTGQSPGWDEWVAFMRNKPGVEVAEEGGSGN